MKLFSCENSECKSHIPHNAFYNKVIERIVSDHQLNANGDIDESKDAKIHDVKFICGRCGSEVKEVHPDKVMKVRILKINDKYVYGDFVNKLRGKHIFKFILYKETGKVEIKGLSKVIEIEKEYIKDYYKFHYIKYIEAEIIDYTENKYNIKTFEVEIKNPDEELELVILISEGKIIDYFGDRKPNEIEEKKALKVVENSPY